MPGFAITALEKFLSSHAESKQWPVLRSVASTDNGELTQSLELTLYIQPSLNYFAGHFPEHAVLPGVVQVHWAGELAKHAFGLQGFSALQGTKFNNMVLPETTLTLSLTLNPEKANVKFSYHSDEQKYSQGTIAFSATD